MRPFISGEFTVANIKRVKISELFFDESGDRWYKCKVNFITLDEKSGVEKRTASYMMVQAADFKTALENLLKGMKGTMADYEIASITETLIMDVFRYDADSVPAAPDRNKMEREMNDIARHLDTVKSTLPAGVSLVAVSKFHPAEALREAYDAGQRIFGESRVQELVAKQTVLPSDIEWALYRPFADQ